MLDQKLDILIVEDNPGDYILICSSLEESGLAIGTTTLAKNIEEARQLVSEKKFTVALLDLFLGATNGLETLSQAQVFLSEVPVIVLSGISNTSTAFEALNLGAQDYLVKGEFNERQLAKTIRFSVERKEAQANARFQANILGNIADSVIVCDMNGKIVYWNKGSEVVFGYTREEMLGGNINTIQLDEQDGTDHLSIIDALENGKEFITETYRRCKDGTIIMVELKVCYNYDTRNRISGLIGISQDITARKNAERLLLEQNAELKKTNAELDRFVYSVSHDLRSPLSSVLGLIGLFRMNKMTPENSDYLDKMELSIRKLDRTILKIVQYSRNSRLPVKSEKIDFRDLVNNAIGQHRYMDRSGKIEFQTDFRCETDFYCDRERLEIIVNNLVANAIKYQREQNSRPFVRVEVSTGPDKAFIRVSDNGEGISPQEQPSIFDMFYRGTSNSDGSGLGLYIVKEALDVLNGTIKVQSVVNEGTDFSIEIINFETSGEGR
ncbi:MAG: pas/pac sensor signal transduction histidine kinase [Bacteroidetes bacterium]|nr:MAG: pas/pac sensor signal transduction histidine kinase [Bacteroidota bacterium]